MDKKLNLIDELNTEKIKPIALKVFKSLVAGVGNVSVNKKGKTPQTNYFNQIYWISAGNQTPRLPIADQRGFFRRVQIIEINQLLTSEESESDLFEKELLEEIGGIVYHILHTNYSNIKFDRDIKLKKKTWEKWENPINYILETEWHFKKYAEISQKILMMILNDKLELYGYALYSERVMQLIIGKYVINHKMKKKNSIGKGIYYENLYPIDESMLSDLSEEELEFYAEDVLDIDKTLNNYR